MLKFVYPTPSSLTISAKEIMYGMPMCLWSAVGGRREGKVDDGPLVALTHCDGNDMSKKLDLEPEMAKVRRALNIPLRFHKWRWLFREYQKKASGIPTAKDIEKWRQYGLPTC
ncbi:unnamed protein product [Prunus armeniaca]